MTVQTITFPISEALLQRVEQAASILHLPVEEVLTDTLAAALPDTAEVPSLLQAEITRMTWLSNAELWRIARRRMSKARQEQLTRLASLQKEKSLTIDEQTLLEQLRQEYGRITLCKARAYAILSLRGGKPLLATA